MLQCGVESAECGIGRTYGAWMVLGPWDLQIGRTYGAQDREIIERSKSFRLAMHYRRRSRKKFPVFPDVSTYFLIFPDQGGKKV